ncbi:hypothetical protein GS4_25_00160 [Gordonia soli NBRC 108243]|uniref:Polyhydroxybutyrate depolymerase n=1 Tax=Gordonia soli NBRC 108243 TaxID=1223545 RepID=M0QME1_9ACTN|nr:hypothetical protein GS4_25_00160 [Gordonia soli NBRC 108243]
MVWCVLSVVVSILASGLVWATGTPSASAEPLTPVPQAACTGVDGFAAGTTSVHRTEVNGVERTYRVHVPADFTGRSRYPLILAYHGRAEKSTTFERYTRLSALPAIVVFPAGLPGTDGQIAWQGAPYSSPQADDIAFTRTILREVRTMTCVDRTRTFAVGRSNGGGFVGLLACQMTSDFAAYAAISGAFYAGHGAGCATSPPVSVLEFHGTADPIIKYKGGVRFGGRYAAVQGWLDGWIRKAGCVRTPISTRITADVDRLDWPVCGAAGHQVTHYRINGGGHRWPGSTGNPGAGKRSDTISASSLVWQFFSAHPKA